METLRPGKKLWVCIKCFRQMILQTDARQHATQAHVTTFRCKIVGFIPPSVARIGGSSARLVGTTDISAVHSNPICAQFISHDSTNCLISWREPSYFMCQTNTDKHVTPKNNSLRTTCPSQEWNMPDVYTWAVPVLSPRGKTMFRPVHITVLWSAHTIFVLQVDGWTPTQVIECIHSSHVFHTPWREQRLKKQAFWHIWCFL